MNKYPTSNAEWVALRERMQVLQFMYYQEAVKDADGKVGEMPLPFDLTTWGPEIVQRMMQMGAYISHARARD